MTVHPPKWDNDRLISDLTEATQFFREERMHEPLEEYSGHFQAARSAVENVLEETVDLSRLESGIADLLLDPDALLVLRYLTAPPISTDDLKTVAEAKISSAAFKKDPGAVRRISDVLHLGLDRNRFIWMGENREPTDAERLAAVLSTASLMAHRKVLTGRAHDSKNAQEQRVKNALLACGFEEVKPRRISALEDAPGRGQFCGESDLGSRKSDVVVRLWDNRVLAIECKVSNSATNSVKRLNNDAAVKAGIWLTEFGVRGVVPSAMLAGVYKLSNLDTAQHRGLTIWWSHDLDEMVRWIELTRL